MRRRHEPPRAAEAHRDNSVIQKNSTVLLGDCLDRLKDLPDNSVDQIVTDPPYGLKFMGKDWDKAVPSVEIWRECFRVLKPGAFAFIMSSPRQDLLVRMYINLEAASFRTDFTSIYWTYASGFPKAQNAAKAIDKKLGAKPKIVGRNPNSREKCCKSNTVYESGTVGKTAYITEPATNDAKLFAGAFLGFQPKPAVEPVIVVMKPMMEKTFIKQAMTTGKGITWLGDCRLPYADEKEMREVKKGFHGDRDPVGLSWSKQKIIGNTFNGEGRFPANLLISDDVLDDGQEHPGGSFPAVRGKTDHFGLDQKPSERVGSINDSGRFSKYFSLDAWAERNLPFLIVKKPNQSEKKQGLADGENKHPTVKPVQLMAYLITMGSREGDVVLDPFTGAGTTGMAAKMLGRRFIGVELSEEFHDIAVKRIASVGPWRMILLGLTWRKRDIVGVAKSKHVYRVLHVSETVPTSGQSGGDSCKLTHLALITRNLQSAFGWPREQATRNASQTTLRPQESRLHPWTRGEMALPKSLGPIL